MDYIAHIRESDQKIQSVTEHLCEVAELCYSYGEDIGASHMAYLAGILHDAGKFTEEFKEYILTAVENPDNPPKKGSVDHSTAGGRILYEYFHTKESGEKDRILAEVIGNAILSHHSGLQDFVSPSLESAYLRRIIDKELPSYPTVVENLFNRTLPLEILKTYMVNAQEELTRILERNHPPHAKRKPHTSLTLLMKYIFSCLIDADRTNTRQFEENELNTSRTDHSILFTHYYNRLINHINTLNTTHTISPINQLRNNMSEACDQFAERPSGVYTLSIPTGGGKTLASLRYALKHAREFGKKRVIYIIPYTSIIEQNAREVREILNAHEELLEHHSNILTETTEDPYVYGKKIRLAKDNWDAPIVFTTMVQYLNAFYDKGTRNVRRLHNLSNAVLIFDEVQSVPIKCVSLFNESINFLKNVGNSSILLCTATQPALDYMDKGIDSIDGEIVADLSKTTESFKRVEIMDYQDSEGWSTDQLTSFTLDQLEKVNNMLIILNTKTAVRNLYKRLKEETEIPIFHLSTSMCARHRQAKLDEVKEHLAKGEKVVCLSTQLIEAGVDISFECVTRSMAGLDSVAQAAGRCNRHGERELGNVYIINHKEESLSRLPSIKIGAEIASRIFKDKRDGRIAKEVLSPDIMSLYFKNYYHQLEKELSYPVPVLQTNLYNLLGGSDKLRTDYAKKYGKALPLMTHTSPGTAAEYFQVIDQQSTTVLVPYLEGKEIIAELNEVQSAAEIGDLFKRAQNFTINVFEHELRELDRSGDLISILDGKALVLRESSYDREYGLTVNESGAMETTFI